MKQFTFNEKEEQALLFMLDAAVKHLGLQAADAASLFKGKIEGAQAVVPRKPRKRKPGKVVNLKDDMS